MQNVAIEVVNLDDAVAEQATRKTIDLLSTVIPLKAETLLIEPHDDVRGIWARVDLDEPEVSSSSFEKHVVSTVKALINLQLHNVTSAVIHVRIDEIEGEM